MEALIDEKKQILKDIDYFLYRRDKISVFTDAVEFDALDLSIRTVPYKQVERIERMNQIIAVYTDEQERKKFGEICSGINNMLSKMLDHYGDHLGEIYMELSGGKKAAGQYFTPYHVSRLLAEMTVGQSDLSDDKILTLNEPCCGSGGIIVATAETLKEHGINYTNTTKTFPTTKILLRKLTQNLKNSKTICLLNRLPRFITLREKFIFMSIWQDISNMKKSTKNKAKPYTKAINISYPLYGTKCLNWTTSILQMKATPIILLRNILRIAKFNPSKCEVLCLQSTAFIILTAYRASNKCLNKAYMPT